MITEDDVDAGALRLDSRLTRALEELNHSRAAKLLGQGYEHLFSASV